MKNSFSYTKIIQLHASTRIAGINELLEKNLLSEKLLVTIFNGRNYDLTSKNFIKNFVELNNVDHMMYSMRPTSSNLLKDHHLNSVKYFHALFALQCAARYGIKEVILDFDLLGLEREKKISYKDFSDYFNEKCIAQFTPDLSKKLPLISSYKDLSAKLSDVILCDYQTYCDGEIFSNTYNYNEKSILETECDLFFLNFDPNYKSVPHDKPYTYKYPDLIKKSNYGKPIFDKSLRYCTRCCMPETMEGISFDEFGVCVPCRSSEEKMHINWEKRLEKLEEIIAENRSVSYYDCMLPMSGGKDSIYQAYLLTHHHGLTPLAVTHGQNWNSLEGRYNLENTLINFDLDHLIFIVNRKTINKAAAKSIDAIGDACWHCHIGAGTFPVQTALYWDLNLMCWGESIAERDGRGSYLNQSEASLLYNLDISAKVKAEDYVGDNLDEVELSSWFYPSPALLEKSKIRYIHLGDYYFWDEERQVEFIKRHFGWMESKVENTYKGYKSVECVMAGVHDYTNFIKRGIGRATVHASDDVRRGLLTREEAFEVIKQFDNQRPHALDYYLDITKLQEELFERKLEKSRMLSNYASKLTTK